MRNRLLCLVAVVAACAAVLVGTAGAESGSRDGRAVVECADLVYGHGKTSKCFADQFLRQIETKTNIVTSEKLSPVNLESPALFHYPFAVMSGEGAFELTEDQRDNLRTYLQSGGFLVASAGCSSQPWIASMRSEIATIFPNQQLKPLEMDHPIFHTVYDIHTLGANHGGTIAPLEGLEIDGKIVMVLAPDGLNDTPNAGPGCCCCGGNEIHEARKINVNLLAYALTH